MDDLLVVAQLARLAAFASGKVMGDWRDPSIIPQDHNLKDDEEVWYYEDSVVVLIAHSKNYGLEVIRVGNRNPVLQISKLGEVTRSHGDLKYAVNQLRALVRDNAVSVDAGENELEVRYEWRRKPNSRHVELLRGR